ncbi:zinc finger protein 233-like [Ornithodoros turicata]|uniref:zinc finger protein 233-like n=1 Tax=Ornithodoros turicata TaxID=34597 RepID=UPI0031396928
MDEKPYNCDLSSSELGHSTNLWRHMLTHTGKKLHKCNLCLAECSCSTDLQAPTHMRTGEKPCRCKKRVQPEHKPAASKADSHGPSKCDLSSSEFSQGAHVWHHQLSSHVGEKPYKSVKPRCNKV